MVHSYCPIFFSEVPLPAVCSNPNGNARNTAGGTTLHELTHALADTNDHQYGCPEDKNLAASSPTTAMDNADNYNVRVDPLVKDLLKLTITIHSALLRPCMLLQNAK